MIFSSRDLRVRQGTSGYVAGRVCPLPLSYHRPLGIHIFYDYMYILLGLGFCDVLVPAKKIKIKGNAQ